jgi:hypothetical protein
MKSSPPKVEYMVDTTRSMIKTLRSRGLDDLVFSATLYKHGKKLNSIDLAEATNFSRLVRQYVKTEVPDKVRVELKTPSDNMQRWMKQFELTELSDDIPRSSVPAAAFQGFGEADIQDLVNRRFVELERHKELERVNQEIIELRDRNADMEKELESLHAVVEAKKQLEYYSAIIGAAFPGLANFLKGTAIGPVFSFLAGNGDPPAEEPQLQAPQMASDQTQTTMDMICEFIRTLNEQEVATLYLLMIEIEKDRSLLQQLQHFITHPTSA